MPLPSATIRPRWMTAAIGWLAVVLCLQVGCRSEPAKTGNSPDELVGSPVRPGSGDEQTDDEPDTIRRGALWYRIAIERESLSVTVRLLRPADRTSFFLPDTITSDAGARRAFTMGEARGPDGSLPVDQFPDEGRLDVETADLDWVEVDYQIDLTAYPERPDEPTPTVSEGRALVYAPDVLVVPSKRVVTPIRDIPIEVHAPADWELLATWPPRERKASTSNGDRQVSGFVAPDIRSLRDAFLVTGPDIDVLERAGDADRDRLTVAFDRDFDRDPRRYAALVERTVDHYRQRFGSVGPVLAYFRTESGDDPGGVRGTAKRGGFVVRTDSETGDDTETALLVAHEAFHLWNGHELVPAPDYDEQTRWFKEGATHYVAIKTLYRTGLFDLDDVRREIGRSAFYYRRNPATRGRRATALDVHRLPYDRGLLLMLAFDAALLKCSSGRASIDDWLTALLDDGERFYDPQTLRATFDRAADGNCPRGRRIWRMYVDSEATLKPEEILGSVGLHLLEARTLEETKVLPVEGHDETFRRLFSRSTPSAPAKTDGTAASTDSTPQDTDDGDHE